MKIRKARSSLSLTLCAHIECVNNNRTETHKKKRTRYERKSTRSESSRVDDDIAMIMWIMNILDYEMGVDSCDSLRSWLGFCCVFFLFFFVHSTERKTQATRQKNEQKQNAADDTLARLSVYHTKKHIFFPR